jgi:ATP synthase protein I
VVFPGVVGMAEQEPGKDTKGDELSETARQMRAAEPYISAVWKLVGGAVVGVLGGYFLDKWLGTSPWFLLGLSLVGISVGFYGFLREMARLGKRKR